MKYFYYIILLFSIVSCCKTNIAKEEVIKETKNIYTYLEQKTDSMHNELNNRIIDPDYVILVDNDTILFDKFIIKPFLTNEGLSIKLNDNLIKTYEFKTLNQAENGFVELSFASNLKKVKYYKNDQLMIFELNSFPCTGLGCLIEFHLIYDLKSKKIHPFGMFRNYEGNLYRFPNLTEPYYLSKSYEGDLNAGEFKYEYTFFKISEENSEFVNKNNVTQSISIEYQDYIPTKINLSKFNLLD